MKSKLLVLELWGLGDLALASRFLQAASERFEITLVAKPFALDLQPRLWPRVKVIPFLAPWTAFGNKYKLLQWPWRNLLRLRKQLVSERFDIGLSARWDPRDPFFLALTGSRERIGYRRAGGERFLTRALPHPTTFQHRFEDWRGIAEAIGIHLPSREQLEWQRTNGGKAIMIHVGAAKSLRVWALNSYHNVVKRLRERGYETIVACDPDQEEWWLGQGEKDVVCIKTIPELVRVIDRSAVFIGNDSGPGHVAAAFGLPTFTIFGNNLPELFVPVHPQAEWINGKPCIYKPCWDKCRFSEPFCITGLTEEEVWAKLDRFVSKHVKVSYTPRLGISTGG